MISKFKTIANFKRACDALEICLDEKVEIKLPKTFYLAQPLTEVTFVFPFKSMHNDNPGDIIPSQMLEIETLLDPVYQLPLDTVTIQIPRLGSSRNLISTLAIFYPDYRHLCRDRGEDFGEREEGVGFLSRTNQAKRLVLLDTHQEPRLWLTQLEKDILMDFIYHALTKGHELRTLWNGASDVELEFLGNQYGNPPRPPRLLGIECKKAISGTTL
ncbi:hypothetical protein GMOD_00004498 [Pyrenophora seminiperda CCB06]|uniref:Uncharacterized protein n=1 Tax=Pyrenophora seminiperda CCB06 TaxID=1302712 RepID=A0A3M7M1G2_9PLEO|nr:hypothetical protein GMOD_00004498 [Pyrenophora seminiperda CCB06]